MLNEPHIRLARPTEAHDIAILLVETRSASVPSIHCEESVAKYIATVLIPRGSSYVLVQGAQIEAWLDVYEGWVDQLYCRMHSTGKGYGSLLLDFAKQLFPGGLKLYTFQVNQGARRFYRRKGFTETAFTDGAQNEEREPDVLLEFKPNR